MKQFIRNSILALVPYVTVAVICASLFGHFWFFLGFALFVFILIQLTQLYHFQKWCVDQSLSMPSLGFNQIWKNIYFLLETKTYRSKQTPELIIAQLQNTAPGDYGIVLLKDNKIVWFNEHAGSLLKLDADRDKDTPISHLLRVPIFIDTLNEKHYGKEIILEDRQPPLAIFLLPCGADHLAMLVRDLSYYIEAINTNQELTANLAHELRSPLTVIYGYLDILKNSEQKNKDDKLEKILDNMQVQVTRIKDLTDNILNIAYLENTELSDYNQSRVNVPEMLKSILASVKTNAHRCRFDLRVEDFCLRGNASELHSVFYNLIDNAKIHSQSEAIKIVWRREQKGAFFEVIDKGIGIAADYLPKLSRRFYKVDPARSNGEGNSGLGLAIVKHVLHRHQATLKIESEIGKGSRFICCFPLSRVIA